jgi:predicted transposase YbfD/YdcC
VRRIATTTRLEGYLNWPGAKQVCLLERTRRVRGEETTETVCAVTSLTRERASATRLLGIARGHWVIANRLHWVRDLTFGEDACRVRTGEAPQILAAMRNAILRLLRARGADNIAATLRRHAAKAHEAIHLVMNYVPS